MTTGTYQEPAFQIGVTLAEELEGQVLATNDPWIKLSVGFRPYLAQLSGNQLKVLLAIGLRINEKYKAWPSLRTIAKECDFHFSTASRAIEVLEEMQLVEVVRKRKADGSHEVNRYKIKAHFAYGSGKNPKGGVAPAQQGVLHSSATGVLHPDATEEEPLKEDSLTVVVGQLTKIGISKSVAKELAAEFPEERVREVLRMANGTNADNLPGLVVKSLRMNWKQIPHRGNGRKLKSVSTPQSEFSNETVEEKQAALRLELGLGPDEFLTPGP